MAVLREDIVKITYDVDSGPLSEVGSAVDSVMSETESAVKQTENAVTECINYQYFCIETYSSGFNL